MQRAKTAERVGDDWGAKGKERGEGRDFRYGSLKGLFQGSETRSEPFAYLATTTTPIIWDEGERPGDLVVDYVAISFGQTNPEILSTPGFVYKIHQ